MLPLSYCWRVADGLLSYDVPQGLHRGPELDLTDRTYDGREEGGHLSRGLGQLVDGQKGQDNFRLDLAGHGKGNSIAIFGLDAFTFILRPSPGALGTMCCSGPIHSALCLYFVSILSVLCHTCAFWWHVEIDMANRFIELILFYKIYWMTQRITSFQ